MSLLSADGPILRVWVLITGLAGFGAAVGAYRRPRSPHDTLYCNSPHTIHPPFARMYATWLLTSTAVRAAFFAAAQRGPDTPVFWLAFATYVVAAWHFVTEIFVFRAAALLPGGFMPLIVAGGSIIWFTSLALR